MTDLSASDGAWHLPSMLFEPLFPDGRTLRTRRNPRPRWTLPNLGPGGCWAPGDWVTANSSGPLSVSGNGVLVMGVNDLAKWAHFGTVLAQVETDTDESATDGHRIVVRRARPVRLVPGWTDDAIRSWAFDCIDRAVRIHAPAALDAANLPRLSRRLREMDRISDSVAVRGAVDALERVTNREDFDSFTALGRAVDGAISAASYLAAPEIHAEDDDDEPDDDADDDEPDEAVATVTEEWLESRRLADEERAAKYAAKAARWACRMSAECVAMGTRSKSEEASYSELVEAALTAAVSVEYRFQSERLAEYVGL